MSQSKGPQNRASDSGLLPSTQGFPWPCENSPAPSIPVGNRGTPWVQGPPRVGWRACPPREGDAIPATTHPSLDTLTLPDWPGHPQSS